MYGIILRIYFELAMPAFAFARRCRSCYPTLIKTPAGPDMLILIDNYDSFTWDLWHFLSDLGGEVEIIRNDAATAEQVLARAPEGLVLSPGPGTPQDAGMSIDLIRAAADACRFLASASGISASRRLWRCAETRRPAGSWQAVARQAHRQRRCGGIAARSFAGFSGDPLPFAGGR